MNYVDIKGEGTMELSDGVLHLRWNQGTCVGIAEAKAVLEAIATLGQGARLPTLVDIHGVTHSPAARKVFPDPSTVSRMALLGLSPVDRVVASFRLPLLPIGFPVKYFTSAEEALVWLREQTEESGTEQGRTR